MMMKRKRSSNREAMERTEFSKDATRLLKEFQYLRTKGGVSVLLLGFPELHASVTHPLESVTHFSSLLLSPFLGAVLVVCIGLVSSQLECAASWFKVPDQ